MFDSLAQQPAALALRALLRLDDHLSVRIDLAALAYGNGVHVKHRLTSYHDFFVERIKAGESVLDVGCGYGAVACSIAMRRGATFVGIDSNSNHIHYAREHFQAPGLSFVLGNALTDLPAQTFDVVVLSNVLEHIERRVEFLGRVQSQIQPTRWLIRVPMFDRDWRVPLRKELGMFYFSDGTHHVEYTLDSFKEEMQAARLTIEDIRINWGEIWAEVRPTVD